MKRTVLATCCLLVLGHVNGASQPHHAAAGDPIAEWSVAASAAATASGMPPLRTPISLAILHTAMFEAVLEASGSAGSAFAAATESGYRILLAEFPTHAASLQVTYDALLADEPDSPGKALGLNTGSAVAARVLEARAADGRNATTTYVPSSGAGVWAPTPPGFLAVTTASLAKVTPFTMTSPSQFRPAGPPALGSKRFAAEFNEVKALGAKNGSARSPEQTATAWFWEPLAGTVWVPTIRRLAREQRLDLHSSARFQAAAFAALADGLIACWDAKLHFNSWRPVTAIRRADADGNPRTEVDHGWESLSVTPNFPEYPSGHTCVTAAVGYTIENYFGRGVAIPARNIVSGEERVYRRAEDVVDEVVEARMLLGLHFRSGNQDGAEIGRRIARQIRGGWLSRKPLLTLRVVGPGAAGR
jgi:hypothetical protein